MVPYIHGNIIRLPAFLFFLFSLVFYNCQIWVFMIAHPIQPALLKKIHLNI